MSGVAFQLADLDQNGNLSAKELYIYLRSTTRLLCQLSEEVTILFGRSDPDEIAWIITADAFEWVGKKIDRSDFSYDTSLSTTTGSHCDEKMDYREFQNWYFYGNGLQTPHWRERVRTLFQFILWILLACTCFSQYKYTGGCILDFVLEYYCVDTNNFC